MAELAITIQTNLSALDVYNRLGLVESQGGDVPMSGAEMKNRFVEFLNWAVLNPSIVTANTGTTELAAPSTLLATTVGVAFLNADTTLSEADLQGLVGYQLNGPVSPQSRPIAELVPRLINIVENLGVGINALLRYTEFSSGGSDIAIANLGVAP